MLGGTHLLFGFFIGTLLTLRNARVGSVPDGRRARISGIVTCADSRGFILDDGTGKAFVKGTGAGVGERVEVTGTAALLDMPLLLDPIIRKASLLSSPLVLVSIGALIPDLDHQLGGGLGELWGHRGIVHTPFFALLLAFSVFLLLSLSRSDSRERAAYYIFLGYMSHLLLDCITVFGIMVLFPFSQDFYSLSAPLSRLAGYIDPFGIVPARILSGSPFWNNFLSGTSTLGVISVWVYRKFF